MARDILLLIASLAVLTLGAEALVRGAAALAKRMGVSSFFIGLTIVGFGTSAPELATGVTSAIRGMPDINVGNVVGSNIFNIAVILGITALIAPIPVNTRLVRKEAAIVIAVAFAPYLALASGGVMQRWVGGLLVALLGVYLWRGFLAGRREGAAEAAAERELERELGIRPTARARSPVVDGVLIAMGLAMLVVGARLLVDSAVSIARTLNISELAIALTIVAGGTSAPELATSLIAALRKQSDISVGNILGSNIFNILGIMGVTSLALPQRVSEQVMWMDAPVMIAASVACLPIMMSGGKISRIEGGGLLAAYAAYLYVIFALAPGWFPAAG